jgi:hypothetical protein
MLYLCKWVNISRKMEPRYQRGQNPIHKQRVCKFLLLFSLYLQPLFFCVTYIICESTDVVTLLKIQQRNVSWKYRFRQVWEFDWIWQKRHFPLPHTTKFSPLTHLFRHWNVANMSIRSQLIAKVAIFFIWSVKMTQIWDFLAPCDVKELFFRSSFVHTVLSFVERKNNVLCNIFSLFLVLFTEGMNAKGFFLVFCLSVSCH